MHIKIGDKVKMKSYEEVTKNFPNRGWNEDFFKHNYNEIATVLEIHQETILNDMVLIKCFLKSPFFSFKIKEELNIDIRSVKKINSINLPSNLFEL